MNIQPRDRRKGLEADGRSRDRPTAIRQYWGIVGLMSGAALAGVLSITTIYLYLASKSSWAFVTAGGTLLCFVVMAWAFWVLFVPPRDDTG